jgi:hypothetical protein
VPGEENIALGRATSHCNGGTHPRIKSAGKLFRIMLRAQPMTFDAVVDAIGQIEAKRHWHAVAAKPPSPDDGRGHARLRLDSLKTYFY